MFLIYLIYGYLGFKGLGIQKPPVFAKHDNITSAIVESRLKKQWCLIVSCFNKKKM